MRTQCFDFNKTIRNELESFLNGYDGAQLDVMSALVDKIEHMIWNIGSPVSIEPMLKSIANGNIKKWGVMYDKHYFKTVKQLKGMHITEIQRKCEDVMVGHFRWNHRGYMVDRYTRDYIFNFWFNDAFVPVSVKSRMKHIEGIPKIVKSKWNGIECDRLIVETKSYRWFYYIDFNLNEHYYCNINDGTINNVELEQLRSIYKTTKRTQLVIEKNPFDYEEV